jgi:hypothetical protein
LNNKLLPSEKYQKVIDAPILKVSIVNGVSEEKGQYCSLFRA